MADAISVQQLRHFLAVARLLSFSRAAEELHLATSPLSRSIRSLEQRLGAVLFERDTRRVQLTAAGRLLVAPATDILARLEELPGLVQGGVLESITIGVSPTVGRTVADRFVNGLSELLGVPAHRSTNMSPTLIQQLRNGDIDLALTPNVVFPGEADHDPDLIRQPVTPPTPVLIAVPRGSSLEATGPLHPGDLAGHPFVVPDHRISLDAERMVAWLRTSAGVTDFREMDFLPVQVALVAGGEAASIAFDHDDDPLTRMFHEEQVTLRHVVNGPVEGAVAVVSRRRVREPAMRRIIGIIRDTPWHTVRATAL